MALELEFMGLTPMRLFVGVAVLLVVILVARVVARRRWESSGSHVAGEVVGVVGRPGSGKTLFAVRHAAGVLRRGGHVVTNFGMTVPDAWPGRWSRFTGWDELIHLQDCVVILDEAHLEAPSGVGSSTLSKAAQWYLSQVRRMGVSLIWVSQHEMRVNKTLRDLTNYIWVCNSFRGGRSFKATQYEPENLRKPEKHLEIRRWRADESLWPLFDSYEILTAGDADETVQSIADERNRRRAAAAETETPKAARLDDDDRSAVVRPMKGTG